MIPDIKIFSGNATPLLASKIAHHLNAKLCNAFVDRFSDGEINVEIKENIRGREVFIIQSTCTPANESIMELIIMADAIRRASAASITAVVPYFGYARQDRRVRSRRVPITAKVVADMMASVGFSRLITVDLHADQIQGFFDMPVDNVYASPVMLSDIELCKFERPTVVSPDVGGVVRARAVSKSISCSELAIIDKRRPRANEAEVMHVIGDVKNRNCIIVDDIVDTAGTLCQAAKALKQNGAKTVTAYCTHPVLSGPAIENIKASDLDELIITDTIPQRPDSAACPKIRQVSLSGLLAETIYRVTQKESVSSMFVDEV